MPRPILCLDFDGVLSAYKGNWRGATVIDEPPVPGAIEFVEAALDYFDVCVFSSRSHQPGGRMAMAEWMVHHGFPADLIDWLGCANSADPLDTWWRSRTLGTDFFGADDHPKVRFPVEKPPFSVALDDRVLTFRGQFPTLDALRAFRAWWQDHRT